MTADRPAAELLAELQEVLAIHEAGGFDRVEVTLGFFNKHNLVEVLERFARAEQALAGIEALHVPNGWELCLCCKVPFPCLTVRAVRASQGGQ